ncbi:hypothetical protein Busp01_10050 [Trinickia caryophylli]|nr:hypothetical protein Busp01_10050 [Trinickia caryophylli]
MFSFGTAAVRRSALTQALHEYVIHIANEKIGHAPPPGISGMIASNDSPPPENAIIAIRAADQLPSHEKIVLVTAWAGVRKCR